MNAQDKWALFHQVAALLEQGFEVEDIVAMHPETAPTVVRNTVASVLAWQKRKAERPAAA